MSYKCDKCDFIAHTTGGLLLHNKVKHSTESKPVQKKPASERKPKPAKKKEAAADVVKESKSRHKKQLEDYATLKKKWRKDNQEGTCKNVPEGNQVSSKRCSL